MTGKVAGRGKKEAGGGKRRGKESPILSPPSSKKKRETGRQREKGRVKKGFTISSPHTFNLGHLFCAKRNKDKYPGKRLPSSLGKKRGGGRRAREKKRINQTGSILSIITDQTQGERGEGEDCLEGRGKSGCVLHYPSRHGERR